MALTDMALVGCAMWAKAVSDETPPESTVPETPEWLAYQQRVALARAVVAGRYDQRVKDYIVAFYGDGDTTVQATVTAHCGSVLAVFLRLGLS